MYLTVIIDLFNRQMFGWSMSDNLRTKDIIDLAWNRAVKLNTNSKELIFHSNRESQDASYRFTNIIKIHGEFVKQSISRKRNCWARK